MIKAQTYSSTGVTQKMFSIFGTTGLDSVRHDSLYYSAPLRCSSILKLPDLTATQSFKIVVFTVSGFVLDMRGAAS